MLMIKNGSWWIDVEPFCAGFHSWRQAHYSFNLARHGSFSQITNMVISLLIQTGLSFSNSVDCHKAVKHSVTLVRTNNDEKWHTGAALAPQSVPSLWRLNVTTLFPSLCLKLRSFTKLLNYNIGQERTFNSQTKLAHPTRLSQVRKCLKEKTTHLS